MFLRARRWSVGACAFHIQPPAKRTLRMSTFVLPVLEKLSSLMCDKMVWLALLTEHHTSSAWTSPLLPPVMPSVMPSVCDHVGKNRAKQEMTSYCLTTACQLKQLFQQHSLQRARVTDSQKPISAVMRVCHPYSIMWTILGAWE